MNKRSATVFATFFVLSAAAAAADPSRVHVNEGSDPRAIEIAQATVAVMGGWDALDATRYVSWNFFGRRQHYWDRHSGDLRIESARDDIRTVILMNIHTKQGRVFTNGEQLEGETAAEALEFGQQAWVNDAYWMFMPYKLLDPGVTLGYVGEKKTAEGHDASVLELTFSPGVGYTPENRYHVYVGKDSGLVEQWDYYAAAADEEAAFASPWKDWKSFGAIKLATNHGRDADWDIAVYETLPASVFNDPGPVAP